MNPDQAVGLIEVSWLDTIMSFGLIMMALGIVVSQRYGLVKELLQGSLRSIIQLSLIGYVFLYIFQYNQLWFSLGILMLMGLIAALTAKARIEKPFPLAIPILWVSILSGTLATLAYVTLITMNDPVAYSSRYLITLGGLVLGNALNAMSQASERFRSELIAQRDRIECLISLGASADKASHGCRKAAFVAAMIPSINAMMVIGLIQFPGTMTGQILANVDILTAVHYQLIIMFMLVGGKAISLAWGLRMITRQYFTPEHQLRWELL